MGIFTRFLNNIFLLLFLFLGTNLTMAQEAPVEVDPRVKLYYSEAEIIKMKAENPLSIKKLNYYFQNSYFIVPADGSQTGVIDPMSIDARRFEAQRHATEKVSIVISANDDRLVLISLKELEKEYKKLR
ncbi:MAG: hypothetical protein H0X62_09505 [Bacteroidetes bacterium]|nr:hypothetical protein [Bacteroidota bacterium]